MKVEQEECDRKVRERVLVELETTVWDSDWFYELVEKKIREILLESIPFRMGQRKIREILEEEK